MKVPLIISLIVMDFISTATAASAPRPAGVIDAPEGIARDAAGNLYVGQLRGAGIIYKAAPGSAQFAPWATVEPGHNPGLLGLAVDDARGRLYACAVDRHKGAVYSIPLAHPEQPKLLARGLGFPNALAIRGRDLLVSDCGLPQGFKRGRILCIDPDAAQGQSLAEARELLRIVFPNGLAVRDDVLYIAQTNLHIRGHGAVATYRFQSDGSLERKPFAHRTLRGWPDGLLLHGDFLYVALQKARTICRLDAGDLSNPTAPSLPLVGCDGPCAPASLALSATGESLHFTDVQEPSALRLILGKIWPRLAPRAHHHVYELPFASFPSRP